jgi:uncharacterized protein (TIGR04255 family)
MAPKLTTLEGVARSYELLSDLVPVIQAQGPPGVELSGPGGFSFVAGGGPPQQTRMIDRERTLIVTLAPTAIIVETSAYERFEDFLRVITRVLEAAEEVAQLSGIQRVGLRYIDEIRVDAVDKTTDWRPFIHPSLLVADGLHPDFTFERTEGMAEYAIAEDQKTVMRFGAMRGSVVDPNGPLRLRRTSDGGPFFLIDLDSFWLAQSDRIPEFDQEKVIDICVRLRAPIRALFEKAITDKLRDEVFRKEVEND